MFQGFHRPPMIFSGAFASTTNAPWFEAQKQTYLDHVQTPMRQLAQEVYEKFSARHEALPLMVRVSRIYRDARRLYGRGPYKSHLWFSLRMAGDRWAERPVLWFEIYPAWLRLWHGGFMRRSPPPWPGSVRTWMSIPRP